MLCRDNVHVIMRAEENNTFQQHFDTVWLLKTVINGFKRHLLNILILTVL